MIVLDASFIVKLVLEEDGSGVAEKLFREWVRRGEQVVTVDIALSETLNALWKHYLFFKDINLDALREALKDLLILWNKLTIVSTQEVAEDSLELAVKENIAIYDSLYIALAQHYMAALATFDTKQREKALKLGLKTYP